MIAAPPAEFATVFGVPPEVGAVVRDFRSCEFSTLARDGTPVTWPTMPFFEPEQRRFLITSSVGLMQKAVNIRRDPRVAMRFSDPTCSGLVRPPGVLIQGDAEVPEGLADIFDPRFDGMARLLFERTAVGWRFRPRTFVTAPVIPWDRLNAIKREIAAAHAADAAHR
jgi:hypothetical protein